MHQLWVNVQNAITIILHGDDGLVSSLLLTLHTCAVATAGATAVGVPLGVIIGLGRFRGRAVLHGLANASLGLPPVLLGLTMWIVANPPGPLGSLGVSDLDHVTSTICFTQGVLALPYIVALTAAAVQGLGQELLTQSRLLGAGRRQVWALAVREARIGIIAAVIAGLAATLSEVGAQVALVVGTTGGGNTLVGNVFFNAVDSVSDAAAIAFAIVLLVLVIALIGVISFLQHTSRRSRPVVRRRRSRAGITPEAQAL